MKLLTRCIDVAFPAISILLLVLQIVFSNTLATHGKQVGELEKELRLANDEKELLQTEVASASALLPLRRRAESLGFVEPQPKQILTLTREVPVAIRQ